MATRATQLPDAFRTLGLTGPGYWVFAILLALIILAGGYMVVFDQWVVGLGATAMNNRVSWGLEIVNFVFFIGLSAGGIIIAALAHVFGIREYKPVARVAEVLAISCLILALFFILVSVGRPDRLLNLLLYMRLGSPLVWDVIIINLYLAMALALGYFGTRADVVRCMKALPQRAGLYKLLALGYTSLSEKALARDRVVLKVLSFIAIPGAVALHSLTAWILGLIKAKPFWNSALMAPLFVASAVVSGLGLLIATAVLSRRFFRADIQMGTIRSMGRVLLYMIPLLGYFLFAELLTVVYPNVPQDMNVFREMFVGRFAPAFWFQLIVGLVVPFLLLLYFLPMPEGAPVRVPLTAGLVRARAWTVGIAGVVAVVTAVSLFSRSPTMMATGQTALPMLPSAAATSLLVGAILMLAAAWLTPMWGIALAGGLVALGVLGERFNVVIAPFTTPLLPYPPTSYAPNWQEIVVTLGIYALGGLAFIIFAKLFPLVDLEDRPK
ncbi:MAG: polysulfide reductase NrfD [Chloroflexi bacterium]|nr:polysulfide reductase NrfD [Chloroflexota bacterium]